VLVKEKRPKPLDPTWKGTVNFQSLQEHQWSPQPCQAPPWQGRLTQASSHYYSCWLSSVPHCPCKPRWDWTPQTPALVDPAKLEHSLGGQQHQHVVSSAGMQQAWMQGPAVSAYHEARTEFWDWARHHQGWNHLGKVHILENSKDLSQAFASKEIC